MERTVKGIWIPIEVWEDDRLTMIEKGILAEIDSLDGEEHCYASNEYIATFCSCSERCVSSAVKKLIDLGYISKVGFDGRTRILKSNLSLFLDDGNSNQTRLHTQSRVANIASLNGENMQSNIYKYNNNIYSEKIDEKINNKINNNITYVRNDIDEQFETFWKAYPRHTNTSKKETKNCFIRALRKTDLDTILSAIELQKMSEQWKKNGTKYIPMPTTWLNGEHWDDEVEIEESQKVYDHESTAYKDARWLSNKINSVNPTIPKKQEDELQKWAYGFELMETVDGHPPLEVLRVMKYSQESEWWRKKVTSPWDIRKNYLKLLREATEKGWFSE